MEEFYEYTLPSGMRCIHCRNKSKVAHCCITVNAGSRDELRGEYGAAHLTEHTIFKGTAHRRAYQVNCRLENLGGELNAFTTKEDTTVHATVLRGDFPKAVELLSDIVFNSTFPGHEVEREKEVVIDEINTYKDIAGENIFDDFEALLFDGSTLGNNILGTARSVRSLTGDKIKRFVQRTYTPDQMVFASVGAMSGESVQRVAERYFAQVSPTVRNFSRAVPPTVSQFDSTVHKSTAHQSHCIIGGRAYTLADPRRVPFGLLINMLGGPAANSTLNVLLREHNGLSYSVEASYTPMTDTGLFTVYFSSDKDKTDRCTELVRGELNRFRTKRLSPRALGIAKKQYAGQFAVSMESPEGYMLGVAKSFMVYGTVDNQKQIYDKINSITADDIMQVADEMFDSVSTLTYV